MFELSERGLVHEVWMYPAVWGLAVEPLLSLVDLTDVRWLPSS